MLREEAYTEPHHLIPISQYRDFDNSVDVMENIVSLLLIYFGVSVFDILPLPLTMRS